MTQVTEKPKDEGKKTEGALPEKAMAGPPADRIPPAVERLMHATPRKSWPKIRAFLIESEEEGDLVELLPELNRAMKVCLPKLIGRVRRHEITVDTLDNGYRELHDAIHGVRQALYALLVLAGFKDPEKKESTSTDPASKRVPPAENPSTAGKAAPAPPDRLTLAGRSGTP